MRSSPANSYRQTHETFQAKLDRINNQLTCTHCNIFKVREALGGWATSERLKINLRLATQSWGGEGCERKREIFYYHPTTSKLGIRNVKNWNNGLPWQLRHQHTFSLWPGVGGEEGRGGEGLGLGWRDEVGSRKQSRGIEVGKDMWVATNYWRWRVSGAGVNERFGRQLWLDVAWQKCKRRDEAHKMGPGSDLVLTFILGDPITNGQLSYSVCSHLPLTCVSSDH